MDVLTGAVLSGVVYDMLKHQVALTASNIKAKLSEWVIADLTAQSLQKQLEDLEITSELSELAIEKKLSTSSSIQGMLKQISAQPNHTTYQSHSGSGDNIAGDKIINNR